MEIGKNVIIGIWEKIFYPTFNQCYVSYYLCKCGFYGDEIDFLNDGSISQIEEKVYENGRKYIGQFKNGKREGYGIMFFLMEEDMKEIGKMI